MTRRTKRRIRYNRERREMLQRGWLRGFHGRARVLRWEQDDGRAFPSVVVDLPGSMLDQLNGVAIKCLGPSMGELIQGPLVSLFRSRTR